MAPQQDSDRFPEVACARATFLRLTAGGWEKWRAAGRANEGRRGIQAPVQ